MNGKQRVEKELDNLRIKSSKLFLFIKGDKFNSLSSEEKTLLQEQYDIQLKYISILEKRLEIWKD
jgi:hypothetical protein